MSYDIHGTWDSSENSVGALARAHTNLTEIEESMQLLWRNHIDPARGNFLQNLELPIKADNRSSGSWSWILWP